MIDPVAWVARRGGLTTNIHALVDACGLPIALKLTEGQAHDGRAAVDMLASLRQGDSCSAMLPTISMSCAKTWRRAEPGPASSPCPIAAACQPSRHSAIAHRNLVERFFNKPQAFSTRSQRAMTRHQKTSSQLSSLPQL